MECQDQALYDDLEGSQQAVCRQFGGKSLAQLELSDKPLAVKALGALFDYLSRTQITGLERMNEVDIGADAGVMGWISMPGGTWS